jgi:predicted DNA-binding transcriptional regulator AlpA
MTAPRLTQHGRRPTLAEVRKWPATVDVEAAASAVGVSRSTAYEAIRCGTFPVRVITVSRRKVVITASLVALLEGTGDAPAA